MPNASRDTSDSTATTNATTSVKAPARPQVEPRSKPKRLPPYAVVIENDDAHSFPYVIDVLRRVFGYGWFRAFRLTMQAHVKGRAAVWTGPLEVAEFKRDRIRSIGPDFQARQPVYFPLGCVIEPVHE